MPTIIRPLQPADYPAAAALFTTTEPQHHASAAAWRNADQQASAEHRTVRYSALAGEPPQLVGYGAFWRVREDKYRLELIVAPGWRRHGIGGRLMREMLDALALHGAATVQARTDEEDLEALTFLWRYGFVETQRLYRLRLDIATAPPTPWQAAAAQLAAQGIAISTLAYERAHDPNALHKLYALHTAANASWPDPDPGPQVKLGFEEYLRRFTQEAIVPEGVFIARLGEQYVGYSALAASPSVPQQLHAAGSVVRPEWQRHGIATALKLRTIGFAQQQGYSAIIAHAADPTLLAINIRLGFRRERGEVRLVLTLT